MRALVTAAAVVLTLIPLTSTPTQAENVGVSIDVPLSITVTISQDHHTITVAGNFPTGYTLITTQVFHGKGPTNGDHYPFEGDSYTLIPNF